MDIKNIHPYIYRVSLTHSNFYEIGAFHWKLILYQQNNSIKINFLSIKMLVEIEIIIQYLG